MSIPPAAVRTQRILSRKQSTRRLSYTIRLSSSETIPSEHSSLYDAAPLSPFSQTQGDALCSEYAQNVPRTTEDVEETERPELPDPERHVGTKLSTIIEQRSVPSLKTVPSIWDFQRRGFSPQPKLSLETAQARHSRTARRRCYSADDNPVHMRHNRTDFFNDPSADGVSESQSFERYYTCPPAIPVQPLYRPPERIQTPTGLPRWPGETDHDQSAVQQLTVRTSRRHLLIQYLRRPLSRPKLKEVLRGERTAVFDRAVRTGTRFWRPPTSGHSTRRYEELESHPFSFVPIADARAAEPALMYHNTVMDDAVPSTFGTNARCYTHNSGSTPRVSKTANSQPSTSTVGESLRALRRTSQNAVPVSMHRASSQAVNRSATVPAHIRSHPTMERMTGQTSQSSEIGTMRTADLVASFPSPPGRQQRQAQSFKRSPWSLFPTPGRSDNIEQRHSRTLSRQAPTNSDESGVSNVAIRGESQARYRHSGAPVYDPDVVSLRTFDREGEDSDEHDRLGREAAMVVPRCSTEIQRAISNGAICFSTRRDAPTSPTLITPTQPNGNENHAPAFRVPHLEPPKLCKHQLAKLRSFEKKHPHVGSTAYGTTQFDGTSTPMSPSPILSQDHVSAGPSISTQARTPVSPAHHIDRPPTTTTFATAPNGATTFTISPTTGPPARPVNIASAPTSSTMSGRA